MKIRFSDWYIRKGLVIGRLPATLVDSWQQTVRRQLSKVNTANIKFPHIAIFSPANKTSPHNTAGEFRFLFCSGFGRFFCHVCFANLSTNYKSSTNIRMESISILVEN